MKHWFSMFARHVGDAAGHPAAFAVAVLTILAWAVLGPAYGFSNTWQLVINTGTTIVTFLMVFLIQHTQNQDTQAIQQTGRAHSRHEQGQRQAHRDRKADRLMRCCYASSAYQHISGIAEGQEMWHPNAP